MKTKRKVLQLACPLAQVRAAIAIAIKRKFSGQEFAQLLGIDHNKLRSIETGRERVSQELAETITQLTGAAAHSLQSPRAEDIFGKPYTSKSYLEFVKTRVSRQGLKKVSSAIGLRINALLAAANENGKVFFVLYSLAESLKRLASLGGLSEKIGEATGEKDSKAWATAFLGEAKGNLEQVPLWGLIEHLVGKENLPALFPVDANGDSNIPFIVSREKLDEAYPEYLRAINPKKK